MNSRSIAATELPRLEAALVGAALAHVDEAILLRKEVHPDEIENVKLREVLRAVYAIEPSGLLETRQSTMAVLLDLLHRDGVNVSPADLIDIADQGAWPGTHLGRVLSAWKRIREGRRRAEALEEMAERVRRGEHVDLADLEGGVV